MKSEARGAEKWICLSWQDFVWQLRSCPVFLITQSGLIDWLVVWFCYVLMRRQTQTRFQVGVVLFLYLSYHSILALSQQEQEIKNAYCRPNKCTVADAALDFVPRPPGCLALGHGRWVGRMRGSEGHIHVLGISQELLVCLLNGGWEVLFAPGCTPTFSLKTE